MCEVENLKYHILEKALYMMLVACNLQRGLFFVYNKTPFNTLTDPMDEVPKNNNDSQKNIMDQNQQTAGYLPYGTGNSLSQLLYLTQFSQNSFSQISEFNNLQTNKHSNHFLINCNI